MKKSFVFFSKYEPVQTLRGHTDNVCVVDGMYYRDAKTNQLNTFLASASVDSTVRIWKRESDYSLDSNSCQFVEDQVINSKTRGFALALKFYVLPISKCKLNRFQLLLF